MDEKKDLTALTDLPAEDHASEKTVQTVYRRDEHVEDDPIEGLEFDNLMEPMSLGENSPENDVFTNLPPLDPEIQRLAAGAETQDPYAADPEFVDSEPAMPSDEFQMTALAPNLTAGEEWAAGDSYAGPSDFLDSPPINSPFPEPTLLAEPSKATEKLADEAKQATTAAAAVLAAAKTLDEVRNYSDHLAPSATPLEHPHSLLITGSLKEHERETLLKILSRENLGIREVELDPQFEAGKILIPRISEFAGVMIIQALRNTTALMRLGPSEKIFASRDSVDQDLLIFPPRSEAELLVMEEGNHPSDGMILTPDETLSGRGVGEVIDTLHSSMNIKATQVAHPQSSIFQDAMEKLKRQLKLQAHHRGANALLSFKYELHPLEGHVFYKLVVQAKAVRI